MFLLVIAFAIYNQYTTPVSTVILSSSVQVKYGINKFDKIVYVYSPDDSGKDLIQEIRPMDKNMDTVIRDSIKYYNENKLVSINGVLITVNGKALEYGKLSETGDYIVDNNIFVLMNNAGNQHKLSDNIIRQREEDSENEW